MQRRLLLRLDRLGAVSGSVREPSDDAADSRGKPQVLPTFDHACDFGSGRSAKIEKNLSAPLGVKDRFVQ
jgi:hypothetical protein